MILRFDPVTNKTTTLDGKEYVPEPIPEGIVEVHPAGRWTMGADPELRFQSQLLEFGEDYIDQHWERGWLIANHPEFVYRRIIAAAVAAERERCEGILEKYMRAAIRAEGTPGIPMWDDDEPDPTGVGMTASDYDTLQRIAAKTRVDVDGCNCDVCHSPLAAHGPTMEHPVAFQAGREYERERCAKVVEDFAAACHGPTGPNIRTLVDADLIAAKIREGE